MKLLFIMFLGIILSGCGLSPKVADNQIKRQTFNLTSTGTYSLTLETSSRTSQSLMFSRLSREMHKTCQSSVEVVSKEYSEIDSIKELVVVFKCVKESY